MTRILLKLKLFLTAIARNRNSGNSSEYQIKVGIVLAEDGEREIEFVLPAGGTFILSSGGVSQTVQTTGSLAGRVMLSARQGLQRGLRMELDGNPPIGLKGESIRIAPQEQQELKRAGGILLRGIIVGRSFHWKTEIDQTLLGTIRFYRSGESVVVVNELPVEWYLAGVITAEMSGECPLDFLKAQAVVARSWYFSNPKGKHGRLFSRCNDDCCQRYQGIEGFSDRAIRAIEETRGQVLTNRLGKVMSTNYSKCCGGIMSGPRTIWGASQAATWKTKWTVLKSAKKHTPHTLMDAPPGSLAESHIPVTEMDAREWLTGEWLKTTDIFCSSNVVSEDDLARYLGRVDEVDSYFRWKLSFTQQELVTALSNKAGIRGLKAISRLEPQEREYSGRITRLNVRYIEKDGQSRNYEIRGQYAIRKMLSKTFLYSSAFVVDMTPGHDGLAREFQLRGGGWGHGAGLCQIGALGMALKEYSYEDILQHYFENSSLKRLCG